MLKFNDTANKLGIIQRIEDHLGMDYGDISGHTNRLAKFTAKVNVANQQAWSVIFQAVGRHQWDDFNNTKYPIIYLDLFANQRDYNFTNDQEGRPILDIYRVAILQSASDTTYEEIYPADAQTQRYSEFVRDDTSVTGVPYQYDKTANGIFLDPIPNYSATNGLKLYVNREGDIFKVSDTTQTPGFAPHLHEYIPLVVSYEEARNKDLSVADSLYRDMQTWENKIIEYYSKRERDEVHVFKPEPINYE